MRPFPPALLRLALLAVALPIASAHAAVTASVPPSNHVAIVVMENKSYDQVRTQPYTASLIASGASFWNSFGVAHPSQPNYFALFAGQTIVTNDNCPAAGSPYPYENLGHACEAAGKTWRAYSENLGSVGSTACSFNGTASTGLYTRKHDPWTYFTNVTHTNERPYTDLAGDLAGHTLPNLVYIIPNNCHNTHNSTTAGCGIPDGDAWLAANLPALMAELGPSGVLILTWDEDDSASGNRILTVFVGPNVMANYLSLTSINHFTVVRTVCDMLGLPTFGTSGAEKPITDIWTTPVVVNRSTWGRLKTISR